MFYNTGVSYKYTAMNFTPSFTPGVHVYCVITYTLSHSLYSDIDVVHKRDNAQNDVESSTISTKEY